MAADGRAKRVARHEDGERKPATRETIGLAIGLAIGFARPLRMFAMACDLRYA
jgi:hypothetical protein